MLGDSQSGCEEGMELVLRISLCRVLHVVFLSSLRSFLLQLWQQYSSKMKSIT